MSNQNTFQRMSGPRLARETMQREEDLRESTPAHGSADEIASLQIASREISQFPLQTRQRMLTWLWQAMVAPPRPIQERIDEALEQAASWKLKAKALRLQQNAELRHGGSAPLPPPTGSHSND